MNRLVLNDEAGAVTADWITLSAGIILLGVMVVFSVMNSAGYLMSEFDDLNSRYANSEFAETASVNATASSREPGGSGLPAAASVAGTTGRNSLEASGSVASPAGPIPR